MYHSKSTKKYETTAPKKINQKCVMYSFKTITALLLFWRFVSSIWLFKETFYSQLNEQQTKIKRLVPIKSVLWLDLWCEKEYWQPMAFSRKQLLHVMLRAFMCVFFTVKYHELVPRAISSLLFIIITTHTHSTNLMHCEWLHLSL